MFGPLLDVLSEAMVKVEIGVGGKGRGVGSKVGERARS